MISRFGLFNILDSECSMPKATDDTCLSDLSFKMVGFHMPSEKPGESILGATKCGKSCWKGKIHSTFKSSKVAGALVPKSRSGIPSVMEILEDLDVGLGVQDLPLQVNQLCGSTLCRGGGVRCSSLSVSVPSPSLTSWV